MTETTDTKRQIIEAKIRALEIVLLSHMLATEIVAPGSIEITAGIAEQNPGEAAKGWPALVATLVTELLDQARAARPAGDDP